MEEIKLVKLEKEIEKYKSDSKNTIIRHSLTNNGIESIVRNQDEIKTMDFKFDIDLKTLPVTNQKSSGRCWLFAALNVCREHIVNNFDILDFEFSESYIAFYDRLEKTNWVMDALIENLNKGYDDRTVQFLLHGIGDGGQWDMFVSLVNKYGLCPKNVFPETFTSSNTLQTNKLINFNIKKFASDASTLIKSKGMSAVLKLKEQYLNKVLNLLLNCYGVPPTKFDFEYQNKEGKTIVKKGFTPLSFKETYINSKLDDYISIINAPTKDKPFNRIYQIQYLGNVVGGKTVTHLNLPMKRVKSLILSQLKDNQVVWFGSDVGYFGDRIEGYWDDNRFDYESTFGLSYKMDKGESLDFRASAMGHAMCITGVSLRNNNPLKWKIENSWGEDRGNKGYFIMSSSWFDQFVYQIVVDKKYLDAEEIKTLKGKPIILKPWDPMGSLAK